MDFEQTSSVTFISLVPQEEQLKSNVIFVDLEFFMNTVAFGLLS
jgi:hypothetical protein